MSWLKPPKLGMSIAPSYTPIGGPPVQPPPPPQPPGADWSRLPTGGYGWLPSPKKGFSPAVPASAPERPVTYNRPAPFTAYEKVVPQAFPVTLFRGGELPERAADKVAYATVPPRMPFEVVDIPRKVGSIPMPYNKPFSPPVMKPFITPAARPMPVLKLAAPAVTILTTPNLLPGKKATVGKSPLVRSVPDTEIIKVAQTGLGAVAVIGIAIAGILWFSR